MGPPSRAGSYRGLIIVFLKVVAADKPLRDFVFRYHPSPGGLVKSKLPSKKQLDMLRKGGVE
ncbi:MAG: hypothetical protein OEW32_14540, partial [Nitrospira sp.]|nr:hypothetical protein [Nitrospira sp.]